ncbi:MAG: hypothetical protein LBR12_04975, partial [Opitutaceae bacterium]|nr:hypothetical protein [Opitutaceae bacterium]
MTDFTDVTLYNKQVANHCNRRNPADKCRGLGSRLQKEGRLFSRPEWHALRRILLCGASPAETQRGTREKSQQQCHARRFGNRADVLQQETGEQPGAKIIRVRSETARENRRHRVERHSGSRNRQIHGCLIKAANRMSCQSLKRVLYHSGIRGNVTRCNLAYANIHRSSAFFEEIAK